MMETTKAAGNRNRSGRKKRRRGNKGGGYVESMDTSATSAASSPREPVKISNSPSYGSRNGCGTETTASVASPVSRSDTEPTSSGSARASTKSCPDNSCNSATKWVIRPSRLDLHTPSSAICRSEFRGFAHLAVIAFLLYMVSNPVIRWYEGKDVVDMELAHAMFEDTVLLMLTWAQLALWAFTAFGLQKLLIHGALGVRAFTTLQHLSQGLLLGYGIAECLYNRWPIVPTAWILGLSVCTCMKMHSYSMTNLEEFFEWRRLKIARKRLEELQATGAGGEEEEEDTAHPPLPRARRPTKHSNEQGAPLSGQGGGGRAERKGDTEPCQECSSPSSHDGSSCSSSLGRALKAPQHAKGRPQHSLPEWRRRAPSYPRNVTVKGFLHFLFVPSLVYEEEYPR
eukprot:GHVU01040029.1.p1 GENE.GHVU01040029.1~~GHVU01040029.1.p1  ORF type:complete len:398 (+),score=59.18 GHVU01040029.1:97-1290(+)